MTPIHLADSLLDALEREGLVPGSFDWERRARRVIAEELERIERQRSEATAAAVDALFPDEPLDTGPGAGENAPQ